ncbi:MAG: hypothetical protein HYU51_08585 [Candidatus Rokubacteria bacterium]|nr:hypothetical protein [Candidatus Rokubacteria bacterium]
MSQKVSSAYWLHAPSGFVWAVQVVDREILCAAGPLLVSEADADILPYLDYSVRDGAWVREHWTEFVGHEAQKG